MISTLRTQLCTSCAVLTLTSLAFSQAMGGGYTISAGGSGSKNFKTFALAAAALVSKGINAPVRFNVSPGTYTESWSLGAVTGSSTTNTISFLGVKAGPIYLTKLASTSGTLITLKPPVANIIFDGFDITNVSGLAFKADRSTIRTQGVNAIEISNCRMGTGIAGLSNRGHIWIDGSGYSNN